MFKKISKYLVLIPCMILGLFLFGEIEASAAEAKLMNENKEAVSVTVGGDDPANKYYFSNSNTWSFQIEYNFWNDRFIKWRVINPEGMATEWKGSAYDSAYVLDENKGKFTISNYAGLSYKEKAETGGRDSVAPEATYYVQIEYWFHCLFSVKNSEQTIKIVVGKDGDGDYYLPNISINQDVESNEYEITASMNKDGNGTGIITGLYYLFSTDKIADTKTIDFENKLDIVAGNKVEATLEGVDSSYKYLYVLASSGNNYGSIVEHDIKFLLTDDEEPNIPKDNDKEDEKETDKGAMDYSFGELILIVLVIVLIVSCVLIITQKIVDYKKRLY